MSTKAKDKTTSKIGITVEMIDVKGQKLRVATKPGKKGRIPLLMVNGIGAGLELAFTFL